MPRAHDLVEVSPPQIEIVSALLHGQPAAHRASSDAGQPAIACPQVCSTIKFEWDLFLDQRKKIRDIKSISGYTIKPKVYTAGLGIWQYR